MKYMWIRVGQRYYCVRSRISTCFRPSFRVLPQGPDSGPSLERAADEFKRIVDDLIARNDDPCSELRILAVTNADDGEVELGLSWIRTDEEVEISIDS